MRRSRPSGKSLLEVVVMISLMSILLGLSATSLASLFRLRDTITRDTEHARSIHRLAMRLRQEAARGGFGVCHGWMRFNTQRGQVDSLFIRVAAHRGEVRAGAEGEEKIVHRDSFSVPAAPW